MTLHGMIKNGVAVIEGSQKLPDGTRVRIEVEDAPVESSASDIPASLAPSPG